MSAHAKARPARKRRIGCWLTGLGVIGVVVGVLFVVGLAASETSNTTPITPAVPAGDETAAHLVTFHDEVAQIRTLAVALKGNPVAPMVVKELRLKELEERASSPTIPEYSAEILAVEAAQIREELEWTIAEAEQRRVNTSGLVSEVLVDEAGNGYIDIVWDAATACNTSERAAESLTPGCVKGVDSLTIHLIPDAEFASEWGVRMTVMHELAHIYQRADAARFEDGQSDAKRLTKQRYFNSSSEAMADCYSLTYYGEPTLSDSAGEVGYGYVCNETERQLIREWAAGLNVLMP